MKPYAEGRGWVLYHGDCREVLSSIDATSMALCLTDAPYGIAHQSNGQIFASAVSIRGDDDTSLMEWLAEWCDTWGGGLPLACFYSPYRPPAVKWRSVLVWNKGAHVGGGGDMATCWKRDAELIGVRANRPLNGGRDSSVLSFNACSPPPHGHFCEKPVPLLVYLVRKLSNDGELVVDPFAGVASIGEACIVTGRRYIGIEIDERWCEVAAKRLRRAEEDTAMFAHVEQPKVQEQDLFEGDK